MKAKSRQSGLTLTEMTVVIAVIALLVSLGLPAVRTLFNSFESQSGGRAVISAAMASARAIAAKEQRYAGIRFQKACNSDDPLNLLGGVLEAAQYMVFIVHDFDKTRLVSGFRAVEGLEPIKLPESIGVMDMRYRPNLLSPSGDGFIDNDGEISNLDILRDTTVFSIIFSPSGKLVIHNVRVRNRDGIYMPDNSVSTKVSLDDIFNSSVNIATFNTGMFVQDDYLSLGLWQEPSRRSFIIYDRREFKRAYEIGRAYSEYLIKLMPDAIYINPYTGTMIEK